MRKISKFPNFPDFSPISPPDLAFRGGAIPGLSCWAPRSPSLLPNFHPEGGKKWNYHPEIPQIPENSWGVRPIPKSQSDKTWDISLKPPKFQRKSPNSGRFCPKILGIFLELMDFPAQGDEIWEKSLKITKNSTGKALKKPGIPWEKPKFPADFTPNSENSREKPQEFHRKKPKNPRIPWKSSNSWQILPQPPKNSTEKTQNSVEKAPVSGRFYPKPPRIPWKNLRIP